jgi:hypothetical protein
MHACKKSSSPALGPVPLKQLPAPVSVEVNKDQLVVCYDLVDVVGGEG